MPFDGSLLSKNYLNKIYKYKNLVSIKNSLTSTTDLNNFIAKFLFTFKVIPSGSINVVNTGGVEAKEIVDLLKKAGIENPEWNFVDLKSLDVIANRSNCVLSTEKLRQYNLELPPAMQSLERDIALFARNVFSK